MGRLVVRRLLAAIPLLLGIASLVFVLVETAPGSPTDLLIGDRPVAPDVRARIEAAYGLDRPPLERYVAWLTSVARGDLGWSLSRNRPVSRVLADALPPTLVLASVAMALHVALGVGLALVSAWWRGRWPDHLVSALGLVLYAMPSFWLGLMAILALAYAIPVFPPSSAHTIGSEHWPLARRLIDLVWHVALPAGVLGLASAAALARFVRTGLIQALGEEFARSARARGAGKRRTLAVHALRNALLPAINLVGLSLPFLVSGSLAIEVVFGWPGMGRVAYEAILAQDVPVVLASTLLSAILVIAGNLAADLGMLAADPRVRLEQRRLER